MNRPASASTGVVPHWRQLVDVAIAGTNLDQLARRIQDAQDAVMDQIEDTFHTATDSERQSLINAMNSLRELRRLVRGPETERERDDVNQSDA